MITRPVSTVPQGVALGRFVLALAKAKGNADMAAEIASAWPDSPHVRAAFQSKAAIASGTTLDATFAAPLAQYGLASEAIALLRGKSIVSALAPAMRRVPFFVKVPRESGSGSGGSWVGEGLSTPVSAFALDTLTQSQFKAQTIVVLTRELVERSNPSAATFAADTITAGLAAYLDNQFLLPTVAATTANPPSITNGATAVVSTGSTAAQISADLAGMLAGVTTSAESLRWVMRPTTAALVAMRLAGAGTPTELPARLFGIPVVISANSPQQITLVDAAAILYSADEADGFDLEIADEALLQMDSVPTEPTVAATVLVSLWQRNLIGVRASRWCAWQRAVDGSVVYMTVAY